MPVSERQPQLGNHMHTHSPGPDPGLFLSRNGGCEQIFGSENDFHSFIYGGGKLGARMPNSRELAGQTMCTENRL